MQSLKIPKGFNGKGGVTTASQSRIPIFSATRRPLPVVAYEVSSPWGEAMITGRLGQTHRDFLEVACQTAIDTSEDKEGRIMLLLDMAAIRRGLGRDYNTQYILDLARDLRAAEVILRIKKPVIQIQTNYRIRDYGGIIDEIRVIESLNIPRPHGAYDRDDAHPWRIVFGRSWSYIMKNDLPVFYRHLAIITALRHGVSQALARWAISHSVVRGEPLENIMGYLRHSGRMRDRIAEVHADRELLSKVGVEIRDNRVFYESPDTKKKLRKYRK